MGIVERSFFAGIERLAAERAILVLHGARQTGKSTTLAWWLEREAERGRQVLYMDLEDPAFRSLCERGADACIAYVRARGHDPVNLSVAFDEIQYLADPSGFLKLLFDRYGTGLRIAVSGSPTFEIKSKFKESLVGRTIPFEVFTLDFSEYCRFRSIPRDFSLPWPGELDRETLPYFVEFAETGAYPGLVNTADRAVKGRWTRQIIHTYVQSDVRELGRVRYPDRFEALLRMIAAQATSLVQVSELASSLRMARETVEEYLFLLEQTYVIQRLRPFHGNRRSELVKMPKLYFEDNGVLAISRGPDFLPLDGVLLENAVFGELRKRYSMDRLRFWRTSGGQEVDFVVDEGNLAIEVKLRPKPDDAKHLLRFGELYPGARLVLTGLEPPRSLPEGVEFLYPWRLGS